MDYKTSKEAFVSGMNGSSITHVNLISSAALSSLALYHTLKARKSRHLSLSLPFEWLTLVLPLLLSMTVFANRPILLSGVLTAFSVVFFYLPPGRREYEQVATEDEPPRPISPSHSIDIRDENSRRSSSSPTWPSSRIRVSPLPALSTYRAHMMLMTCLSILAVDFPVFPRSLAKCETFGVSLMDLGVGSFVFSQGVVSAIPILKDPAYLTSSPTPKILRTVKKAIPLVLLGFIRVIMVKGVEYPEHESEYGRHWNFFFTLAFLPILQAFLHPYVTYMPISLLAFIVGLCHQAALSLTSLQSYTINAPRTGLISANKEGLVSLAGYLAIHLLGLATGTVILPPSPSDFRRQQNMFKNRHIRNDADSKNVFKYAERQDGKTAIELFSYALLWWLAFGLCWLVGLGGGVSRRLANLQYVLWVGAYNTSFILGYIILDIVFYPGWNNQSSQGQRQNDNGLHTPSGSPSNGLRLTRKSPALLEAINVNGLVIFLLANLGTGLVNISMRTMYASDTTAMFVLSVYSFAISAIAWKFRNRRLVHL